MSRKIINTDNAPKAIGTYSQAVYIDKMVFVSGQIPLDPKSMEIISENIDEQIEQAFKNLKNIFKDENIKFVDNSNILNDLEKMHLDLYLMTKCKHYAVVPSAFNWWGTWLSKNDDKIVVRPRSNYFKSLNVKNKDYWPEDWISL